MGPYLESLFSQTQRGTVSSQIVARAVVFNYGQAVKMEAMTVSFCGAVFSFCFRFGKIKITVGKINTGFQAPFWHVVTAIL